MALFPLLIPPHKQRLDTCPCLSAVENTNHALALWEMSCPYFICLADQFRRRLRAQTHSLETWTPHCFSSFCKIHWAVSSGLLDIYMLTYSRWMGLIFLAVTVLGLLMKENLYVNHMYILQQSYMLY